MHQTERTDVKFSAASVGVKVHGDLDLGIVGAITVGGDFATDQDMVSQRQKALNEGLFVGHLGAADDDNEGMSGLFQGGLERGDFALQKQTGHGGE